MPPRELSPSRRLSGKLPGPPLPSPSSKSKLTVSCRKEVRQEVRRRCKRKLTAVYRLVLSATVEFGSRLLAGSTVAPNRIFAARFSTLLPTILSRYSTLPSTLQRMMLSANPTMSATLFILLPLAPNPPYLSPPVLSTLLLRLLQSFPRVLGCPQPFLPVRSFPFLRSCRRIAASSIRLLHSLPCLSRPPAGSRTCLCLPHITYLLSRWLALHRIPAALISRPATPSLRTVSPSFPCPPRPVDRSSLGFLPMSLLVYKC